jgi:hypothetical protein
MKSVRSRFTYANVMSTIGLFLLLAGGTAFAAKQLGKKTVGAKQLKTSAVTTPKIKKGAVTKAKLADGAVDGSKIAANAVDNTKIAANAVDNTKIADNAVTGSKIADGSVSGSDINAAGAPFSQITARLRNTSAVPIGGAATPYPVGTYTQNVGNDDQYLSALDVTFAASCVQPRSAQAFLLLDAPNPSTPTIQDIIGQALVLDTSAGTVTRRVDFGPFPGSFASLTRMSPLSATQHTFTILLLSSSCGGGGSGVNASGALVDVISTR